MYYLLTYLSMYLLGWLTFSTELCFWSFAFVYLCRFKFYVSGDPYFGIPYLVTNRERKTGFPFWEDGIQSPQLENGPSPNLLFIGTWSRHRSPSYPFLLPRNPDRDLIPSPPIPRYTWGTQSHPSHSLNPDPSTHTDTDISSSVLSNISVHSRSEDQH